MVFSEFLIKIPYSITWKILTSIRKKKQISFYCDNELDYIVFKNIHKHLDNITFIAKNKEVKKALLKYNVKSKVYPQFPDVLIIARISLHKFPSKNMLKIGMQHGVYHFKDFIAAKKFNRFDLYIVSSKYEMEEAQKHGIKNLSHANYAKIDDLFDERKIKEFENFKTKILSNNKDKKILLFSATWDKSGLSAIDKWYDKLDKISDKYYIFVTLHSWIDKKYIDKIKATKNVTLILEADINKYLYIADFLIGDTSSLIGEYLALQKPIITFDISAKGRLTQTIVDMLNDITYRINDFNEIDKVIQNISENADKNIDKYLSYINKMYDLPLGNGGIKRAEIIREFLRGNS